MSWSLACSPSTRPENKKSRRKTQRYGGVVSKDESEKKRKFFSHDEADVEGLSSFVGGRMQEETKRQREGKFLFFGVARQKKERRLPMKTINDNTRRLRTFFFFFFLFFSCQSQGDSTGWKKTDRPKSSEVETTRQKKGAC